MFKKGLAVLLALFMLPLSVTALASEPISEPTEPLENSQTIQQEDLTINKGNLVLSGNEYSIYNFDGNELIISSKFPVFSFSFVCDSSITVDTEKTQGNIFVKEHSGSKFYYFTLSPGLLENFGDEYHFRIYFTEPVTPVARDTVVGISSQKGTPTPEAPIPITSNVPAGTYHIEDNGQLYEITLDEDLRGIGEYQDKLQYSNGVMSRFSVIECKTFNSVMNESFWRLELFNSYNRIAFFPYMTIGVTTINDFMSTHFFSTDDVVGSINGSVEAPRMWFFVSESISNITLWNEFLVSQNSNKTPVKVLFCLTTPTTTTIPLTAVDTTLAPMLPITDKQFTGVIYPQYSYTEPPQLVPWQIPSLPIPSISYPDFNVSSLESWFSAASTRFGQADIFFDQGGDFFRVSNYTQGFWYYMMGLSQIVKGYGYLLDAFARNLDYFYFLTQVAIERAFIWGFDRLVAPILRGVNSIIGTINIGITNVVTYINQAITWGYNTFQTWNFNFKSFFNQWFSYFDMVFSGVSSGIGSVGEKLDETNKGIEDANNQLNAFEDSMFGNLETAETNMNLDVNVSELDLGGVTSALNMLITAIITPFGNYAIIFTLPFIFGILGLLLGRGSALVGRFKSKNSSAPKGGKK